MATEMREKVSFDLNVPVLVALEFDSGKLVESRFGDQYQWTIQGNRIAWVSPEVEQQRAALAIRRGEPFIVCKTETREGRKKAVAWKVYKPNPQDLGSTLQQSIAAVQAKQRQPQESNHTAATAPVQPESSPDAAQSSARRPRSIMAGALIAAIDAMLTAQEYARSKGVEVTPLRLDFNAEDCRAMAATLYIQHSKEQQYSSTGGGGWKQ